MLARNTFLAGTVALALNACGGREAPETSPHAPAETSVASAHTTPAVTSALAEATSAKYMLDPAHASIVWSLSHNGLSRYTSRFTRFDAALNFDTEDPTMSTLTATIDPTSIRTDHPTNTDWDGELATDEKFFNARAFPTITFAATGVTLTGENTGLIVGDLTLNGVTKQITLDTTFNGVRNFSRYGDRDVIGFSAVTKLKRSDFGITALLPDIGDEVAITIETEFLQVE